MSKVSESFCTCRPDLGYPRFLLASTAVPAAILPITVALTYMACMCFYWDRTLIGHFFRRDSISASKEAQSFQRHDEENTVNPGRQAPSRFNRYFSIASRIWNGAYTVPLLLSIGSKPDVHLVKTCLIQIVVTTTSTYCLGQRITWDSLSLAFGWVLFLLRHMTTSTSAFLYAGVTLLLVFWSALVILPKLISEKSPTGFEDFSGFSLLQALIVAPYVDKVPEVAQIKLGGQSVWPLALPLFLLSLQHALTLWKTARTYGCSYMDRLRAFAKGLCSSAPEFLYHVFLRPMLFIGILAIFFFLSNYLTSCLPLRRFVFGLPSSPPSFKGGLLGGILYLHLAVFGMVLEPKEQRGIGFWREIIICGEAVVRSEVILVVMTGLLLCR